MFNKVWSLQNKKFNNDDFQNEEAYVDKLLELRGIDDIDAFLNPSLENLDDPFLLPNVNPAIDRILEACENEEKICVFGDYDADGVTATAIMYHFLKEQMEADVFYKIPDRFKDGYGLGISSLDEIRDFGASLIITVDNGISAKEAIEKASLYGIDVVVTDHHEIPDEIPECVAIVNPHLEDSVYPTKNLCGAGVAFKLVMAISISVGLDDYYKYLPFAAIGTIADVVELLKENRIIAKIGLDLISESDFPGIKVLFESKLSSGKAVESDYIGYFVAPRINAAGRLGSAELACELLLSSQEYDAKDLLQQIEDINKERKSIEEKIAEDAIKNKDNVVMGPNENVIIVKNYDWHLGVCGIVAGRLLDKYGKPCIVMAKAQDSNGENTILKASSRSNDSLNIVELLNSAKDFLIKFGGHPKAAGFSIEEKNLPELVSTVNKYYEEHSDEVSVVAKKEAFSYLPSRYLTTSFVNIIDKLKPFGEGNPQPLFFVDDINYVSAGFFGEGMKHLKLTATFKDKKNVEMKRFSGGSFAQYFVPGISGGAILKLSNNEFRDRITLQPFAEDFIESYTEITDIENCFKLSEDDARLIYSQLRKIGEKFTLNDLVNLKKAIISAKNISGEQKNIFTWFKIKKCIDIFIELGYIISNSYGNFEFALTNSGKKLTDSKLFSELSR